jgi:hypothetical protein
MRHVVEVDQSVKIEQAGTTVIAFSNGIRHAVVIPSNVKRFGLRLLQGKGNPKSTAVLHLFAACLFLLLEDHLPVLELIVIDTEYTGQESVIRHALLMHISKRPSSFPEEAIVFRQIGKKSAAHAKANQVRERKDMQYRKINSSDLRTLLK